MSTNQQEALSASVRIGVVGAGSWACRYHLPALMHLKARFPLSITGIWNRTPERALEAARRFGIRRVYGSLEELAEDPLPTCFAVLVHPDALPGVLRRLLIRSLPVFCEKPPGTSWAQARELAELVRVPNLVAFNRRFMPINRRFRELVLGLKDLYFVECQFYRHQRLERDFMIGTGVHGLNYLEYLCGEIQEVSVQKSRNPDGESARWVCQVTFASGLHGACKFFPSSGSCVERYEAHGSELSLFLSAPQAGTIDYPGQIVVHRQGRLAESIRIPPDEPEVVHCGFAEEYLAFFAAIRTGQPAASTFQSSVSSMRVAEIIQNAPD